MSLKSFYNSFLLDQPFNWCPTNGHIVFWRKSHSFYGIHKVFLKLQLNSCLLPLFVVLFAVSQLRINNKRSICFPLKVEVNLHNAFSWLVDSNSWVVRFRKVSLQENLLSFELCHFFLNLFNLICFNKHKLHLLSRKWKFTFSSGYN